MSLRMVASDLYINPNNVICVYIDTDNKCVAVDCLGGQSYEIYPDDLKEFESSQSVKLEEAFSVVTARIG